MKTNKIILLIVVAFSLLTVGCHKEKHFLSDKAYRAQVHDDFLKRQEMAQGRAVQLFGCMDTLDAETREAMEFLYAYMPYSDLADYDAEFYLAQVRAAFAARDQFSWGQTVPEDIFRHFVLVYRVNNEDLDTARMLMQRELTPRLEGLSMYDAALEVNHWCHEHVAYRAADARTSAPLATMRTALGRCGEESTFTVTALRSVGIPARQCYTPRWAHCDDNHAWVEVWIDGRWYFLGACEPDPELDMGWFAVPSTRCMMVHSNVFGRYQGDEEVNFQNALYAKANMLANYAPTRQLKVSVYDAHEKPVAGAKVKYKLYNYSEFYPLATLTTDADGHATLTTGLGDLKVWATDGTHYNYVKVDVRQQQEVSIYLTREQDAEYMELIDVMPPVAGEAKVTPSKEKADACARRIAYEDSLRGAYMATFPTMQNYSRLIDKAKGNQAVMQRKELATLMVKSEGNYQQIADFINTQCRSLSTSNDPLFDLVDYLSSYSDKDLRDISSEVLKSHITRYDKTRYSYEVYKKGIMPARISNELVRPWRQYLADELHKLQIQDADALKAWILEHVAVDDTGNYYNCPISPRGVFELRLSDAHSRDIFFVAACRSLDIPAYLDNATNVIYVWNGTSWQTVTFTEKPAVQPSAKLTLTFKPTAQLSMPTYWVHFTLAKYVDGDFQTFDFEGDERMAHFPATIDLEPGYYCLTTGNRYPDGEVLAREEYFVVAEGQKLTKEIVLRPLVEKSTGEAAKIDPNIEIVADMATLADYAGETGMLFIFMGDYKEPSKHLVKELQSLRKEYEAWGGMIYLVAPPAAQPTSWKLPNTDCIMMEPSQKDSFETRILEALKLDLKNDYPLVALVNNKGEIIFHSHGYSIGLAEQILKASQRKNTPVA